MKMIHMNDISPDAMSEIFAIRSALDSAGLSHLFGKIVLFPNGKPYIFPTGPSYLDKDMNFIDLKDIDLSQMANITIGFCK